ncbi:MAG: sensor histidine kinase [Chitinophagaceae bacterium]
MVNAKVIRHTSFWIAINFQGTLLQYSWLPASMVSKPSENLVWLSLKCNLLVIPVKMAITYYTMYIIKKAFLKEENFSVLALKIIFAMCLAVLLHRFIGDYFIAPLLFPGRTGTLSEVMSLPLTLISLMDLGYVAGIAAALKLFGMSVVKGRRERTLLKDKLETELKFLKNQINPHFLFNTLNNIYSLSRKKSDKAPEVVMKLSKLLRFMLYESGKDAISITDEIKILNDYVALEKIRYNDRLSIRFDVSVDNADQRITPLILLPFIENAFKHGINGTTGASEIEIAIHLSEGRLHFTVTNSRDQQMIPAIESQIGLRNVRRQLELLYREFSLTIDSPPGSFTVVLEINLNAYANI